MQTSLMCNILVKGAVFREYRVFGEICAVILRFVRELKLATFFSHGRHQTGAVFLFNLSSLYHIFIVKYLFTSRDDY